MDDIDEVSSVISDDSVFCSVDEVTKGSKRSTYAPALARVSRVSMCTQARRSSIFELSSKPKPCGSTTVSYAHDPSKAEEAKHGIQVQYENTYKMEPVLKFSTSVAEETISQVLTLHLQGMKYDPVVHSMLCKVLAQEIKERLSSPELDRYKLVSFVTIGEKKEHDVRMASRCLWDTEKDNCAAANYENESLYAVGIIYALYYE